MEYKNQPHAPSKLREPTICSESLGIDGSTSLCTDEIAFFKENGYLLKSGLIPDHAKLERIVDYVWETIPPNVMSRNDTITWVDKPHRRWPDEAKKRMGVLNRGIWKMRSPQGYGTESFIVNETANHSNVRTVVEEFIGNPVKSCKRVRGVYVVLPKPIDVEGGLGPHVDHAAAQLCAMVFIGDTPPRCGGFTIWPGSHKRLHPYWQTRYGAHFDEQIKDRFEATYGAILKTVAPVEFAGKVGDVVFWHPRLIHSAGVNYSIERSEPLIRYIVPCDFQRDGGTFFDDDDLGPGESTQWWVDTRHFREDTTPTPDNMWDDWVI